jgi:hypothetical protein
MRCKMRSTTLNEGAWAKSEVNEGVIIAASGPQSSCVVSIHDNYYRCHFKLYLYLFKNTATSKNVIKKYTWPNLIGDIHVFHCYRFIVSYFTGSDMTVLYHLIVLSFFVSFDNCSERKTSCMYVNVAMVLDCSDLGLDYIPSGYKNVLDMRRNNISSVSEGTLLGLYPNLDLIDLRENPINCRKAIFSKIKVKVNCVVSTNTVQTKLLLSSQQFYYTTSTAMQMDLRTSKKCLRCVSTSTRPRQTWSSSLRIKLRGYSPPNGPEKLINIIVLATFIPTSILILSVCVYRFRSVRCFAPRVDKRSLEPVEMPQIGSTQTIDTTDSSLSI